MAEEKKQIGKYDILGVLGKGAMGLVYRGVHRDLGREVGAGRLGPFIGAGGSARRGIEDRRISGNGAVGRLRHADSVGARPAVSYDQGYGAAGGPRRKECGWGDSRETEEDPSRPHPGRTRATLGDGLVGP